MKLGSAHPLDSELSDITVCQPDRKSDLLGLWRDYCTCMDQVVHLVPAQVNLFDKTMRFFICCERNILLKDEEQTPFSLSLQLSQSKNFNNEGVNNSSIVLTEHLCPVQISWA